MPQLVQCVNGKWSWPGQKFSDAPRDCNRLLTPTLVLGHEEDDDENKFWATLSTGVPSVGIITRLWRDGEFLKGDADDVSELVTNAITSKAVRKVSCEIYDSFEDEGVEYGMALRRVALLGAEIPQVKTLADLPMPNNLGNLRGIELFATGLHPTQNGDHDYTIADLDQIVANFKRLSTCGTQVKMSERMFHVFYEVRKMKIPTVFQGPNGKWYWDKIRLNKFGGPGSGPHPGSGQSKQPHEMTKDEYNSQYHIDPTRAASTGNLSVPGAYLATGYKFAQNAFSQGMSNGRGKYESGLQNAKEQGEAKIKQVEAMPKPPNVSDRQFQATKDGVITGIVQAQKDMQQYYTKPQSSTWGDVKTTKSRINELANKLDEKYPPNESNHRSEVYMALQSGKVVPSHVLADHPDLAKRVVDGKFT